MKSFCVLMASGAISLSLMAAPALADSSRDIRHIPRSVSGGSHSADVIATQPTMAESNETTKQPDNSARARLADAPAENTAKPATVHVVRRGQSGGSAMADQITVGSEANR